MKSYIVTEDLAYLMGDWSGKKGFRIPDSNYFYSLQGRLVEYLSRIFPKVIHLDIEKLSSGLKAKIAKTDGHLVVSIDQIYNNADHHLESNRIADLDTMEVIGEAQRPGHPSLEDQVLGLPQSKPLVLVDDGCFSGDTLVRIYQLLQKKGYQVAKIIVGLVIDRADNRFVKEYPQVPLVAVREFDNVIDWVCERDFYIGVPLSGRTAGHRENGIIRPCEPEVSVPYCLPFGNPIKGASIPTDRAVEFSQFMINISIELWDRVSQESDRDVLCRDVPRLPKGVARGDRPFAEVLAEAKLKL